MVNKDVRDIIILDYESTLFIEKMTPEEIARGRAIFNELSRLTLEGNK